MSVPARPGGDGAAARIARAGIGLGATALVVAAVAGGRAGDWIFAVVAALFPVALIVAATRPRRPGDGLGLVASSLALVLGGGAIAILALAGSVHTPLVAGLPVSTWLMLGGLGLVPLVLTGLGHALWNRRIGRGEP